VIGLLSPNGSGKTTAVRILATLLRPDAGKATVGGYDVTRWPMAVRALVGVTGRDATVDGLLTGRENLDLFGNILGLRVAERRRRAAGLLIGWISPRPPTGARGPTRAACAVAWTWP
jgi:oleandomycin transport system ATP-binding protein